MSNEEMQSGELAEVLAKLDAAWERRKARVLRSMRESPLEKWLRKVR